MGLRANALALLLPYLPRKRVLSLGYPDLVMSPAEFTALTGKGTVPGSAGAAKWHWQDEIPETVAAFTELGTETFRAVDVSASRGIEIHADLNYPQDLGKWDLVIDPGTIEHCFHIGQALMNAAEAVDVGGLILHTPPLTMLNHGFYNLNPTLFHDFYGQNGWEIIHLLISDGTDTGPAPKIERFGTELERSLYILCRRLNSDICRIPKQSKYLLAPSLS
jgi:hypothetical protein